MWIIAHASAPLDIRLRQRGVGGGGGSHALCQCPKTFLRGGWLVLVWSWRELQYIDTLIHDKYGSIYKGDICMVIV